MKDVIQQAASVVEGGGLVAFPTETVYGIACRAERGSLARLDAVKGRTPGKYYSLHIGHKQELSKYVPKIGIRAKKLVEGFWPGPLTVVFEVDDQTLERQRGLLGKDVVACLYHDGSIGVRCPGDRVASALLSAVSCPVVAPSANRSGQTPAVCAREVAMQLSGQVDLILDGGQCRYGKSSTVVRVRKGVVEVLREGIYSRSEIEQGSMVQFLFVCTGNTCRSAMAEGLFKKYLAEKLGCGVDRLEQMGYKVTSAGILDIAGLAASASAVAACAARGVDIRGHRSRPLSRELIESSDFIFAMERIHQQRVGSLSPAAASRCVLLAADDVPDPIGQGQDVYSRCVAILERAIQERIGELSL